MDIRADFIEQDAHSSIETFKNIIIGLTKGLIRLVFFAYYFYWGEN